MAKKPEAPRSFEKSNSRRAGVMTSPCLWEIRVRSIAQIGKIGKRTPENLDTDYPSMFITVSEYLRDKSPRNGKQITGRKCTLSLKFVSKTHCKQCLGGSG